MRLSFHSELIQSPIHRYCARSPGFRRRSFCRAYRDGWSHLGRRR